MEKRYLITKYFREAIKGSNLSIRQLSKKTGFEVKNLTTRNKTIGESTLKKLNLWCNLPRLEEISFDYSKNLGKYAITLPSKSLRKTSDLAELIGIVLGDGNMCRNRIHISFDKRNKPYIKYVFDLFKNITGIKLKYNDIIGTNQSYLYCYNKKLSNQFVKMGLQKGDKITNQVKVPTWIKENKNYTKKCLKGLIDTDGCIYFSKRDKQIYIKFTNFNKSLLEDFKKSADEIGYTFANANKRNVCLYRKDEVVRFIKHIQPFKAMGM